MQLAFVWKEKEDILPLSLPSKAKVNVWLKFKRWRIFQVWTLLRILLIPGPGSAVWWLWSSRARITNRFPLLSSAHAPGLSTSRGARAGGGCSCGEIGAERAVMRHSAQSLIRFCVRVFLRVNRSSQIANSAAISTSWHSFSALTFAANWSTPLWTTSLSRKKFTFPRVPRHVWCGINSLNKINGPCDTERKLELCPRILFLFRNLLMTVKTVGVLGHNRCEQH